MSAASFTILVNDASNRSATDLGGSVGRADSTNPKGFLADLLNYITGIGSMTAGSIKMSSVSTSALAQSSATITFASVSNNDTITINGVVFTAKTSGPTGNQFLVGVSNTADAAAFAVALNASTTSGIEIVTASASTGVATLVCDHFGVAGNAVTIASSNGARLAVGGSAVTGVDSVVRLGGGTGGQAFNAYVSYAFGG